MQPGRYLRSMICRLGEYLGRGRRCQYPTSGRSSFEQLRSPAHLRAYNTSCFQCSPPRPWPSNPAPRVSLRLCRVLLLNYLSPSRKPDGMVLDASTACAACCAGIPFLWGNAAGGKYRCSSLLEPKTLTIAYCRLRPKACGAKPLIHVSITRLILFAKVS